MTELAADCRTAPAAGRAAVAAPALAARGAAAAGQCWAAAAVAPEGWMRRGRARRAAQVEVTRCWRVARLAQAAVQGEGGYA